MTKKIRIIQSSKGPPDLRNPVAKAMHKIQKCAVHRDRKNDYQRRPKHHKTWGDAFRAVA